MAGRQSNPFGIVTAGIGVAILLASLVLSTIRIELVKREIARLQDVIVEQAIIIQTQREQIANNRRRLQLPIPDALTRLFGDSRGRALTPPGEEAAGGSWSEEGGSRTQGQRIVYYAKRRDPNQRQLTRALRDLGFVVHVARPLNPNRASNAVWFGDDVSPLAVEITAGAMLRAGYRLQYIGPIENASGSKSRLIEIGVSPQSLRRPVITERTLQNALRRAGVPASASR